MSEIRFYHLERQNLDTVLPMLLTKALEKGHKILVRTPNEAETERLNTHLWTFKENSFLPHGSAKDGKAEHQPIWITDKDENENNADVLILTHGQDIEDKSDYALICDIFDGNNEEMLSAARARWKILKDSNHTLTYWQQSANGGWEQKS